jgi:hypothetical protein
MPQPPQTIPEPPSSPALATVTPIFRDPWRMAEREEAARSEAVDVSIKRLLAEMRSAFLADYGHLPGQVSY